MPSKFPNLLVNGSDGIAVGMATDIPPHNLGEVCDAVIKLIDNPGRDHRGIDGDPSGPRLPHRRHHLRPAGDLRRLHDRPRQDHAAGPRRHPRRRQKSQIVISEVPFQQTRNRLAEAIGELVKNERIKGITRIRDESSARTGEPVRLVVDVKRDADPKLVLNQLYQFSPLQKTASIILLALVEGRPRTLTLKQMLEEFLRHRVQVIRRRTEYLLREAKRRAHILEGQLIAISSLDEVIAICRQSPSRAEAKIRLQNLEVSPRSWHGPSATNTSPPSSARSAHHAAYHHERGPGRSGRAHATRPAGRAGTR